VTCEVIIRVCYLYFLPKGIVDVLCEACEELKWKSPTKIQKEAIPVALQGTVSYIKYIALAVAKFGFILVLAEYIVITANVLILILHVPKIKIMSFLQVKM
jgi:hypothetical protein